MGVHRDEGGSHRLTRMLDEEWRGFRAPDDPAEAGVDQHYSGRFTDMGMDCWGLGFPSYPSMPPRTQTASGLLLSQALTLYLAHHPKGESHKFRQANELAAKYLIGCSGDRQLQSYSRQDAEKFRDNLLMSNTTGSVRRRLNSVVAIFNKARKEKQLQIINPFEGLGIAQEAQDAKRREPFTTDELKIVAQACHNLDDDIRHIIALQMDTGARAGEIIGLRTDDLVIDLEIPHVRIRPHGTVRTLKTPASERDVPLAGEALWAAGRALEARRKALDGSPWLFPRYASDMEMKATHASNTLNKWLRSLEGVSAAKTTHCFRHAMRDRMRAAMVPHDIQEALGGWGSRTVGQGYGRGYPLQVLRGQHAEDPVSAQPPSLITRP